LPITGVLSNPKSDSATNPPTTTCSQLHGLK
jgi:hypothetical protein